MLYGVINFCGQARNLQVKRDQRQKKDVDQAGLTPVVVMNHPLVTSEHL